MSMIESEISRFFKFFFGQQGRDTRQLHYGWWEGADRTPIPGLASVPVALTLSKLKVAYGAALHKGSGHAALHICLNTTSLTGRRTENIKSVNVLCCDIDRDLDREEVRGIKDKYDCQLIVESSPRRYHFYWKVSRSIPLERWSKYQIGLAEKLDGDFQLRIVTSTIRVPGFPRITKSGEEFTPHVVYFDESGALSEEQLVRKWPWLPQAITDGESRLASLSAKNAKISKGLLEEIEKGLKTTGDSSSVGGLAEKIPVGERNAALFNVVKSAVVSGATAEDAASVGALLNNALALPLDEREVHATVKSAVRSGVGKLEKDKEKKVKQEEAMQGLLNGGTHEGHTNGHDKETNPEAPVGGSKATGPGSRKEKFGDNPWVQPAPESLQDAASQLVDQVWNGDLLRCLKLLQMCRSVKSYHLFAEWFTELFTGKGECLGGGWFDKSGPFIVIGGENLWNEKVQVGTWCEAETFHSFVTWFLHALQKKIHLVKSPKKLGIKEKLPLRLRREIFEVVTIFKDKPVKDFEESCFARVTQRRSIGTIYQPRQPEWFITFQNGTLDLRSGCGSGGLAGFSEEPNAPLKHSHPIQARYSLSAAALITGMVSDAELESKAVGGHVWRDREFIRRLFGTVCPVFSRYLQDWLPQDPITWLCLCRFFGYSMTTGVQQQAMLYLYGPGGAGKGSLMRVIEGLLGPLHTTVNFYAFDGHSFEFSKTWNKTLVSVREIEATPKQAAGIFSKMKHISGGDTVSFERKHQHPFDDQFIGKIVMQGNKLIQYEDAGGALERRLHPFCFEGRFSDKSGVNPSMEILKSEASAVATLCAYLWGYAYVGGSDLPFKLGGSVAGELGKEKVLSGLNIVGWFIKKFCRLERGAQVLVEDLDKAIRAVAADRGIELPEMLHGTTKGIIEHLKRELPTAKFSKHLCRDRKKVQNQSGKRGFLGVFFDENAFLDQFSHVFDHDFFSDDSVLE